MKKFKTHFLIRILPVCSFLLLCYTIVSAQEPLKYQLKKNNPEAVKYFSVGVDPIIFSGESGGNDFIQALRYQINTDLYINKVAFWASVMRSYTHPNQGNSTASSGIGINGISNITEFIAIGKFFFMDKTLDKSEDVKFNSSRKVDYYVKINAKQRRMLGIRGGYIFKDSYIAGNLNGNDNSNGQELMLTNSLTMLQYHAVSIGLSYTILSDILIDLEGYGEREEQKTKEYYCDVIYSVNSSFDDVAYTTKSSSAPPVSAVYKINNNNPLLSNWGIKAGYMTSGNNKMGLRIGIEGGLAPAYLSPYFLIRFGFNFSKRTIAFQ